MLAVYVLIVGCVKELRAGVKQATLSLTAAERSAEEIAEVQSQLKCKASEVHSLKDRLRQRDSQLAVRFIFVHILYAIVLL